MADDTDTTTDLVGGSYEPRRGPVRRGAGSGVEVRVRAVRRRSWSAEDKLRIVRETLEPGAVAKAVADRHGISTGLLFTWRKQLLATAMSGFATVQVVPDVPRSEEHTSELQSRQYLVCRLLLEKKKQISTHFIYNHYASY